MSTRQTSQRAIPLSALTSRKVNLVWIIAAGLLVVLAASCSTSAQEPPAAQSPSATTFPVALDPAAAQLKPPSPVQHDPNAKIVLEMVAALNASDIDRSLSYFAEDARSYFIGMPETGMEIYTSREALRPMWEFCAGQDFAWKASISSVENDLVFVRSQTWMDFTRGLGVAPNDFNEVFQIKDGKIAVYGSTMTNAALDEFKPAYYAAIPPEPTPIPDTYAAVSHAAVSQIHITFSGGTCTTDHPTALKAGKVFVNVEIKDPGGQQHAVTLHRLEAGKDLLDLMAFTAGGPATWEHTLSYREVVGQKDSYSFILTGNEPVYLICWSKPPELPVGNLGPLLVEPVKSTLPGKTRCRVE